MPEEEPVEVGRHTIRDLEPTLIRILSSDKWSIDAAVWGLVSPLSEDFAMHCIAIRDLIERLPINAVTIRFARK